VEDLNADQVKNGKKPIAKAEIKQLSTPVENK
jgi:hypothetical protein